MTNFFHYYKQYIYTEIPTSINEIKIGGFYRLYSYKYEDTNITESYSSAKTPILMIIGKNTQKQLVHAIKINNLPLRRFIKLLDDVQNQAYTRELITEIENKDKDFAQKLEYNTGRKPILIDKTGRSFYKKSVKNNKDLQTYDTYRTYKRKNIKQLKELYFDVSKLKDRLGFKNYNPTNTNI
jgi:hypothetical protein